jgi:hypothetical protein
MNSTSIVSHESIARRAYHLWEESGRQDGNETAHWQQAERELHAASAGTAAAKHVPEKAQHSADYVHPGITTDSLHHHRNRTSQPR